MCYIIGNKSISKAMDISDVSYNVCWANDDVTVYQVNEPEHIFICKISKNLGPDDKFLNAEGCMYSGLLDETAYNVKGRSMIGFVNEDKFCHLEEDEKDVYFEKRYASFSEWLADVMDVYSLMDGWAILIYLAKKNGLSIKDFLNTFEGESKI